MRDYILTMLVTAAVTYVLTPLVRRLAGRIGAIKEPRDRDVHVAPIPLLGGLAMFGGLVAGLLVADQIPQLREGFANTGMVGGLLLAGGLLVIIGMIDDRWGMSALTKAAGQVAAGGILVATGTQLAWLPLPGGSTYVPTPDQATLLTILVVVATINAVNFIDGLDGLAAGIVAIAAVSFFLYYYWLTKAVHIDSLAAPALASAILVGMCLGFLPHNFSPASVFMGDTGSMLLGLLLAYAPISSISSLDPGALASRINRYPEIMPLLLPAALLVIPYGDLLLAVLRRTKAGQSPFAPDRKHLHHRLLDIGHSQRASVLIMYLWAAVFSGSVVWLSHGEPVFVFVVITAAAVGVLMLMSMPRLRWWSRNARPGDLAAAPQPASSSAEPQLVTAAAFSRPAPLPAPVAAPNPARQNGSPAPTEPAPAEWVFGDRPAEGDGPSASWPSASGPSASWPSASGPSASWPSASGPSASWPSASGPSASWPSADRPSANGRPAAGGPSSGRRSADQPPAGRSPSGSRPSEGPRHARPASARSVIGTPPPAVTSLETSPLPVAEGVGPERGEPGPAGP